MADAVLETRWAAMGGKAHSVIVGGSAASAELVQSRVDELEQCWSRFLPTSDISMLNAHRGQWIDLRADTVLLVRCLLRARAYTGGRFDPFLLDRLSAAGYDRTFSELVDEPNVGTDLPIALPPLAEAPIEVDGEAGRARLTADFGLDPGGLGKGLAADIASQAAMDAGVEGVLVNLGGDVRVRGRAPGGSWRIAVEDPLDPERSVLTLDVVDGAVATSSRVRRSWRFLGRDRHHLMDPATGESADTGVLAVTVLAADCWWAETLTTAAHLAGPVRGPQMLESAGVHGIVIDDDGVRHHTAGFASTQP